MTGGVRTGKAQNERMFSGLPPKADYLPILELLPPPTLRERSHRGLGCRCVAVMPKAPSKQALHAELRVL
jgi:hypothetical protein